MTKVVFASLFAHKRRLAGMFVSVFLGVAFLSGTLVMGDTLDKNFKSLFTDVNAGTDVAVRRASDITTDYESQRGVIVASIADQVAAVDGVAAVSPSVEGYGQIRGKNGDALGGNGPPTLAGSWIEDPQLNPFRIAEGRAPRTPDEVVINRGAAKAGDLHVGDTTLVSTPGPHQVTIVGIATFGTEDGLGTVTNAFFTLDAAEQYITGPGQVTSIVARADDGVSQAKLLARIEPVLPAGVEAITGTQRTTQDLNQLGDDFLNAFKTFLVIFAGIALLVAAFSIHNTFSILVAQRTRESALLRTIGASRRQILTWVTVEVLTLGLIASAAGLFGGIVLAQLLKALFASFGAALPSGGIAFEPSTAVISLVAGVTITLLAGAVPAWKASRVAPLAVLRETSVDRTNASRVRTVAGAVLLAGGIALVLFAVVAEASIGLGALGALATIVGVSVFGPVVARPASRVIGAPLPRLRGITGSLARRNAMRNPRRTAGTATALMIGVGVVTLFTVFAASIKASINDTVAGSVNGQLVVGATGFGGGGLSPQLATDIGKQPQVAAALGVGTGSVLVDGSSKEASVLTPSEVPGTLDLDVVDGSISELTPDEFAVAKDVADSNGWTLGTALPLKFADGQTESLRIGAIYDSSELVGNYVLPRAAWSAHVSQSIDQSVVVALRDGVSIDAGRRAVERVAEAYGNPDVLTRSQYVDQAAGNVDAALGLIYVLLALAIIIALMGIANTLALAVYERTAELGVLRAVGTTRPQVRAMVRWEAVIVAVFGTITGIAVGVFLGWGLFRLANVAAGFSSFAIPTTQLVIIVVVGAIAGVLAGLRPARRAAKLDVLEAVAAT
jgi:putative ABC transport system permease protein